MQLELFVLKSFAAAALAAAGMRRPDAVLAAEALVRTEARGILSHGLRQLPRYVNAMQAGGINPRARFQVLRQKPTTALVEGNAGLGHVIGTRAIRLGIRMAKQTDMATVLVRNSSHLGALGHYALLAAEAGMIAMVYSTTQRVMQGPGSRGPVLGNGPMAFGAPCEGSDFVLDISMSVTSGNRVLMAAERGEKIPEGWIVDAFGRPTTRPADYLPGGALVPIAGHKGFGLAFFGEILAGALSGLDWDHPGA